VDARSSRVAGGLTAVVMAGGSSRRMGRDKALLDAGGETWLARIVLLAAATVGPVLVVGRERPASWTLDGVAFALDDRPGEGPLGGLVSALHRCPGDVVAVACDMPRLDRAALSWLLDVAARRPEAPVVAAVRDGGIEPLFAIYRRAVLPEAEARLSKGQRSLRRLVESVPGAALVEAPPEVAERLLNVNTPDELRRL
jgi:molybdenum cofactor guanylyltransferase